MRAGVVYDSVGGDRWEEYARGKLRCVSNEHLGEPTPRAYVEAKYGPLIPACGHCGGPMRGHAYLNDIPLCHPDDGMDCYVLVTVKGHSAGGDPEEGCSECLARLLGSDPPPTPFPAPETGVSQHSEID